MKDIKHLSRKPVLLFGLILCMAVSFGKGSFTDPRDGNVYKTVEIGKQIWMAENLAYKPSTGSYWAYDDNNSNIVIYGYLYDWQTALNVCPAGWRLPSDEDWKELIDYIGDNPVGKLKATGTIEAGTGLWHDPSVGATNQTGFTALPAGFHHHRSRFHNFGQSSYWWSATELDSGNAWMCVLVNDSKFANRFGHWKKDGFSVRCIKD
ncbi:MAG: hypothetical protein KGZ80_13085 [Methylomonas sp.]|jgi:uncharacterized protein (TIGR02145 family)|nr:hypothetical protein [Methylomonas sp.]